MSVPTKARAIAFATVGVLTWFPVVAGVPEIDVALAAHYKEGLPTSYVYATTDLNGDGVPDAVVLVTDSRWCGSGGCDMDILRGTGKSYVFVSSTSISNEPIRVLAEAKNGWRSLSVMVAGGGGHSRDVVMRFNGSRYPANPSVQPGAKAADLAGAHVLTFKE